MLLAGECRHGDRIKTGSLNDVALHSQHRSTCADPAVLSCPAGISGRGHADSLVDERQENPPVHRWRAGAQAQLQ